MAPPAATDVHPVPADLQDTEAAKQHHEDQQHS